MLTSRTLAASLAGRFPDLAGSPGFLHRVLVVEGMDKSFTPGLLRTSFTRFGAVRGSYVIQDDIGDRAGVVVFDSTSSCSAAAASEPSPGSYRRATAAAALDESNHRRSFRHLMNLVGVLDSVCSAAVEDPEFLQRSILVEGVSRSTSPRHLVGAFALPVQAGVLVRDYEIGDRVGLVVMTDSKDCMTATAKMPSRGSFSCCVQASSGGHSSFGILDALESNARRQPTADLLRSLLPPEYLLRDQAKDLHLRCVFLRGPGLSAVGGASGLCRIGRHTLGAGRASAVIMRRGERAGVLVYDDARATERVDMRTASSHLLQRGLFMYDSSMFPLPLRASAAAANQAAAPLARRLMPPFAAAADDHLGRVVLLTGLDAEACYATEVAYFLERTVRVGSEVEAVVVHRALGAAVVVLGAPEDAETLQRLPPETWIGAFRRPVACSLLDLEATPSRETQPPVGPPLRLTLQHWISPMAFAIVRLFIGLDMARYPTPSLRSLTRFLILFAALSRPHALRRSHFPDRAVLMTRIGGGTRRWDLRDALLRYGALDEVVHDQGRGVALVIFTSWTGAARLLREPPASRLPRGFGACQPAPDAGFASVVVDRILNHLLFYQTMVPPYL